MTRGLQLLVAGLLLAGSLTAGAQVPTPQQLELLRSMSPEDRDALMDQLGVSGMSGGGDVNQSSRKRNNRDTDRDQDRDNEDLDSLTAAKKLADKSFMPMDSILVDVDFRKDQPARMEPQGEGLPPISIPAEPAPVLTEQEKKDLEDLIERVRARNPYQLDPTGILQLPGFEPFMLAGLNERQATLRVAAMPAFQKLAIKVTRLPVRKQGIAALKPFGYDLFRASPSTFAPVTDVPVPSEYIVGPGDQINIQLYGTQNRNLRLVVGRDGRVQVPEIGPVAVGGKTFRSVSSELEARISRELIGVRASVSMGDTRSIQVFVFGEASRPGSYTVSGLATITSALYAAGGVKPIGSLRSVQLKRQGTLVRELDLYQLLLHGDTTDDAKLLPGDVIFIPPVSATVAVDGEVQRPAIYELKGTTTVAELVKIAGGPTAEADTGRLAIVRVNDKRIREVVDVPLDQAQGSGELVRNGDSLRVLRLRPTLDTGVVVDGHVFRPGPVAWHDGMRLTDVIGSVDELRPNADTGYLLIRRELPPDRRVAVLSADLIAALNDPSSPKNVALRPRDRITVFNFETPRENLMQPILEELRRQSRPDNPSEVVRVSGRVKADGDYPLEPGMRVSDLLRAGGGLQDAAYKSKAELTRYRVGSDARETDLIDIDLAAILRGDPAADVTLRPFDFLNIKEVPEWSEQEKVTLMGEVRFPGIYPIRRGETLRSVLNRAGGLTSLAFPSGSVFTRVELQKREQEQMDRLADRLQNDLAAAAIRGAAAAQGSGTTAMTIGKTLFDELKSAKAVGRLVIDVDSVMAGQTGAVTDVVLREGDTLIIPKQKQEVTVIGEVQNSTSHFYREGLSRDDYLGMSGGLTRNADRGRVYVVRADGSVVSGEGSGWFRRSAQVVIKPGDTIVAPMDTDRLPPLPLWQAVTQILYNLSISVAAVRSF